MRVHVPLSKLNPSRQNPRWVKPKAEAHRRLIASIRAFGLLEPLVVRPMPGEKGEYEVIAGNRRLAALRQIHRDSKEDPKISCEVRDVDDPTAGAISLSENFVREDMHALDEAEAFAELATNEAKGADAIASMFGTSERFVRQRMKIASLASVIKKAFRQDQIDIGTAEAFSAVPEDRQLAIWQELNGNPQNAHQVRNIIAAAWIESSQALFDLSTIPESAVSRDLFSDRVLIERSVFMEAQGQALAKEREALRESGWAEVVVGRREDVQDRLYAMDTARQEYDSRTTRKLEKLDGRREKLIAKVNRMNGEDEEEIQTIGEKIEALETAARQVVEAAPIVFGEATKAVGSVFLTLDPDGQVRREYRVPRPAGRRFNTGNVAGGGHDEGGNRSLTPPTSENLSDKQLAVTFAHQALAVREALLKGARARKQILVLILNDKVRSEALAVHHDANAVTVQASQEDGAGFPVFQKLTEKRKELDPFSSEHYVEDQSAYARLSELPDSQIEKLIGLLAVECVTAHLQRQTGLVHLLANELKVDIRKSWRPDAAWLSGYQKIQLAHLIGEFVGPTYNPAGETRKKTELVEFLAKLFSDAADAKLDGSGLAERVNQWLPINLRDIKDSEVESGSVEANV
jgi:ParB family chromosome partitioning protein